MDDDAPFDRTSFDLLSELSRDARVSNKRLAAVLGLAPSTTHQRLKQLRAVGVYKGAHAEVELKKLGFSVRALMHIGLTRQAPAAVTSLLEQLKSYAEVRQFLIVTGRFDLVVEITVRDTDHLGELEFELTASPFVDRIETAVVFEAWRQHALPVPKWLAEPAPSGRARGHARRNGAR